MLNKQWHDKALERHQNLINLVEQELKSKNKYWIIGKNKEYDCGEIDLYAIRGHNVLIFEMKGSKNKKAHKKAINQLERACSVFDNYKIYKFYCTYEKGKPKYEWVRNK